MEELQALAESKVEATKKLAGTSLESMLAAMEVIGAGLSWASCS